MDFADSKESIKIIKGYLWIENYRVSFITKDLNRRTDDLDVNISTDIQEK